MAWRRRGVVRRAVKWVDLGVLVLNGGWKSGLGGVGRGGRVDAKGEGGLHGACPFYATEEIALERWAEVCLDDELLELEAGVAD